MSLSVRSTPAMRAPSRRTPRRNEPLASTPVRSTSMRREPRRSVPSSDADLSDDPDMSTPRRVSPLKSTRLKSIPCRFDRWRRAAHSALESDTVVSSVSDATSPNTSLRGRGLGEEESAIRPLVGDVLSAAAAARCPSPPFVTCVEAVAENSAGVGEATSV